MSRRFVEGVDKHLISVVLNAVSVIFAKLALYDLTKWQFLTVYALTTIVFVAPFLTWRRILLFLLSRHAWLAVFAGGLGTLMFYSGLESLDPATHSFVARSYVAFGLVISWFVLNEKISLASALACVGCLCGSLLTGLPRSPEFHQWTAVLYTLGAAFLFAVNYAALRNISAQIDPPAPILATNLAVAIGVVLIHPENLVPGLSVGPLVFAASAATALAMSTHYYMLGAQVSSFWVGTSVRSISPLIVLLLGLPFFHIQMSTLNAVGAALTLVSAFCIGVFRDR